MTHLSSYVLGGIVAALAANALYVDAQGVFGPTAVQNQVSSARAELVTIVNRVGKGDRLRSRSTTTPPPLTVRGVKEGCDPAVSPLAGEVRADIGLRCLA
jgi:hypothetical protein